MPEVPANVPVIPTGTLWAWNTSGAFPVVSGYPTQNGVFPTKTGLGPNDLQQFAGVPIQYYGNPSTPVPPDQLIQWIRMAEDKVEQDTSILLCQTWVASPPAVVPGLIQQLGLSVNPNSLGVQVRGYDYDMEDAAYDFMFPRALDEGWLFLTMRYRPVQSTTYGQPLVSGNAATQGYTALKRMSFLYPLLQQYFTMPQSWTVEDKDAGYVRFVPSVNVAVLPLFALQLAFMGFAQSVPGAMWAQYTAGLTPFDYSNRYSFMKEYVLAEAAITALSAIQGTVNLGVEGTKIVVDGLAYETKYNAKGAFAGLITQFESRRDILKKLALSKVTGPVLNYL